MGMLQNFAALAIFIGVLVFVHELGHFLVAKFFNVKVLKFAIGFGPQMVGFRRGETEYVIGWIPLGGYVKMAGELDEDLPVSEAHRGFLVQAPWKRALIVIAGPAFNLVFPLLVFTFVYLGTNREVSNRVGLVEPGFPAAQAGVLPGDRILKIDQKEVRTFEDITRAIKDVFDRKVELTIQRGEQTLSKELVPRKTTDSNPVESVQRGRIGIGAASKAVVLGVPVGSYAEQRGLKTFDRVLSLGGKPVTDEPSLQRAVDSLAGTVEVKVLRTRRLETPGLQSQVPEIIGVFVELQPGATFAALGAESSDLYVYSVLPNSPLAYSGVTPGDRILSIDGIELPSSWGLFELLVNERKDRVFELTWKNGQNVKRAQLQFVEMELRNVLNMKQTEKTLGFGPSFPMLTAAEPELVEIHRNLGEAFVRASDRTLMMIRSTALGLVGLFTRKVSMDNVGSLGTLFRVASKSAESGISAFAQNMAVVSISLGLVNLLPIPILDGFGLLAALWEAVRRRPIPPRAREIANWVGLVLLLALMAFALTNDFRKM